VDDYSKRLDPGSATPEGTPSARDDTVLRSGVFCFGLAGCFQKTGSRVKSPHQIATRFGEDPDSPWWHSR